MDVQDGQIVKIVSSSYWLSRIPASVGLRRLRRSFSTRVDAPDEAVGQGKVSPGKTVEAGSKLNPLGTAKIPIGLPSLSMAGQSAETPRHVPSPRVRRPDERTVEGFTLQLSSLGGAALTADE